MITGLTHAAVKVTDIDRSLDFYINILGLSEQFRIPRPDGPPWLVYLKVAEGQFIELFPGANAPHSSPESAAVVHICLQVDDIHQTYRELTDRGLQTRGEPTMGADNSWQFWTSDPDGNPIEFHQFTPDSMQLNG